MTEELHANIGPDRTLLLVDDDEPFVKRLAKAMEKRGFLPETAETVAIGRMIATTRPPAYAVVDLRLEDGNGLDVVEALREHRPDCRIVVADRVWRDRNCRCRREDWRNRLSVQAGRCE